MRSGAHTGPASAAKVSAIEVEDNGFLVRANRASERGCRVCVCRDRPKYRWTKISQPLPRLRHGAGRRGADAWHGAGDHPRRRGDAAPVKRFAVAAGGDDAQGDPRGDAPGRHPDQEARSRRRRGEPVRRRPQGGEGGEAGVRERQPSQAGSTTSAPRPTATGRPTARSASRTPTRRATRRTRAACATACRSRASASSR